MNTVAKHPGLSYHSKLLNEKGHRVAGVYRNSAGKFCPRMSGRYVTNESFDTPQECVQFIADTKGKELTWLEPVE